MNSAEGYSLLYVLSQEAAQADVWCPEQWLFSSLTEGVWQKQCASNSGSRLQKTSLHRVSCCTIHNSG